jgi:hypothetical protein
LATLQTMLTYEFFTLLAPIIHGYEARFEAGNVKLCGSGSDGSGHDNIEH